MEWLKREMGKLELPATGMKNELQRRFRQKLHLLQGINNISYDFDDDEKRHLQVPANPSGIDINLLLAVMMDIQEASQKDSEQMMGKIIIYLIKTFWLMFKKLLAPKKCNCTFWEKFKISSRRHQGSCSKYTWASQQIDHWSRGKC